MESAGEAEERAAGGLGGATLWVATTDKIGHLNQCIALTDALGVAPARLARIPGFNLRHGRARKLIQRLKGWAHSLALVPAAPAGPLVLVVSGRSSEYAAKALRWRLGARLFVISVGPPINYLETIDLAVMNEASLPKWRRRRARAAGPVTLEEIPIIGALARRFGAEGAEGREDDLLAVLIGGENKDFALDGARFGWAMARIAEIARAGAWRVEAVLSRRTSRKTEGMVREALAGTPAAVHGREASDSYRALLGRAGAFAVTPDSVTMLSEVCLTGRPVYALDLEPLPDPDREGERLIEAMVARGVVRRFAGEIEAFQPAERLDEAARIAPDIAARIRAWAAQAG